LSFSSYTTLQAAIADWLNRTDLTTQIPDFITLAEAEIKRRLRRTSTRTTMSITAESNAMPVDVSELRSIYLESASPYQDVPLRICTPEMFAERRARNAATAGRPTDIMVLNQTLYVAPTPDQTYTARIIYFTSLTPLSASVASNTVLTEAPDAYLFGALWQAEYFLEHDERAAGWKGKFDAAIDQLNDSREREEYAASLSDIRLPVVLD
jgi:hypothetical protein